ncbi:hypothetical protein FRC17_006695 [Serendipita sp. 399]|nr:hypothetical protein FRC17_006695 [Serendipita sp. 399]
MSLNLRSPSPSATLTNDHGRPLAMDDVSLRAPIVLAPNQVNPLVDAIDKEQTSRTWRLATIGKDHLIDGRRFENALWRLWAQQRLGINRIQGLDYDWNQLLDWNHRALLGPIVISQETCHSTDELTLAYSADVSPLGPAANADGATASDAYSPKANALYGTPIQPLSSAFQSVNAMFHMWNGSQSISNDSDSITTADGSLLRPCMSRKVSTSSERSLSTKSSASPASDYRRRVKFNNCVTRGEYVKEEPKGAVEDGTLAINPDIVDEDDLPGPMPGPPPLAITSIRELPSSGYFTALNAWLHLPLPTWLQPEDPNSSSQTSAQVKTIELLPPTQLYPVAEVDEKGDKVVFVPPSGMEELCEDDLVPVEPKDDEPRGRTLERKQSSVDIIKQMEVEERDEEMERQLICLATMRSSRMELDMSEGEESSQDTLGTSSGARRRRRRERSTFILTEEDEDQPPPSPTPPLPTVTSSN